MGMTWGDKMTKAEIDDIFGEFEIDEEEEEEEEEEGCQVNSWLHGDLDPSCPCQPGRAPTSKFRKKKFSHLPEPESESGKARTRKAFTFLVSCTVRIIKNISWALKKVIFNLVFHICTNLVQI